MRLNSFALILLSVFATPALAQSTVGGWKISCGVDKGAFSKQGNTLTFKPSRNHCDGNSDAPWSWKQRTELTSKHLRSSVRGTFVFETTVAMTAKSRQKFDVFQMHDGRRECAPPLKVEWSGSNQLRLVSEYKIKGGKNDECVPSDLNARNLQRGQTLRRDGSRHELSVAVTFDGKGAFAVAVSVDGTLAITGEYDPDYQPKSAITIVGKVVKAPKFERSKKFYFKHGVYSQKRFDFVLVSDGMQMKKKR